MESSDITAEDIEINTTKEKFFIQYLTVKRPLIDSVLTRLNKRKITLGDIPMRVLAQVLYYNDFYKYLPEEERWEKVFDRETREAICKNLSMPLHHLTNYLSYLRKIQILNKKSVNRYFLVYASDAHSINFRFKVNGHEEQLDEKKD